MIRVVAFEKVAMEVFSGGVMVCLVFSRRNTVLMIYVYIVFCGLECD